MAESLPLWSPGRSPAHRPLQQAEEVRRQRQQAACYVASSASAASRPAAGAGPAQAIAATSPAARYSLLQRLVRWCWGLE